MFSPFSPLFPPFFAQSFAAALASAPATASICSLLDSPRLYAAAMREAIAATDAQVLQMCASAAPPVNYSSTTAVAALISGDLLSVAHLGDSRAALGSAKFAVPAGGGSGALRGRWLTSDHKPDMPEERARIERVRAAALADALASCARVVAMLPSILLDNDTPPPSTLIPTTSHLSLRAQSGGSIAYLHGGKPFLRGGDFLQRQSVGDRPMQLNYSRAIGGKDLKPYGLSAEPGLTQVCLAREDRVLVIASDGLWDVADADTAVNIAWDVHRSGRDPARLLAEWSLQQHEARQTVDNVTVQVVIFRD